MYRLVQLFLIAFLAMGSWVGTALNQPYVLPFTTPVQSPEFIVRYHPDGPLWSGDLVSIEVISPPNANLNGKTLHVVAPDPDRKEIGKAQFTGFYGGRVHAVLSWAWDTRVLKPGAYSLGFSIPETGQYWNETVQLHLPPPGSEDAHWEQAETACCIVHYISGTAAERDIQKLLPIIQAQADDVTQKLGATLKGKIGINLIPRALGQGGFAADEIYVTYREQNFTNPDMALLLHHEIAHRVDAEIKSDFRPSFLVEGLAVYLSGGHYQTEPVLLRASSLVKTGRYLPLPHLMDNFYSSQHETGYIEAGAFIDYLVKTWGWDRYNEFYRNIPNQKNASQSQDIGAALKAHYGLSLEQVESQFTGYLNAMPGVPDEQADMVATIRLYDAVRDDQKILDPSAYFEEVWLPDARIMREKNIVADYLRGPDQPVNRQVEALLFQARQRLDASDYTGSAFLLDQVRQILRQAQQEQIQTILAAN